MFGDLPYFWGLKHKKSQEVIVWDMPNAAWGQDDMDVLGRQILAANLSAAYPLILQCCMDQSAMVKAFMAAHEFTDCEEVYWYKPNANAEGFNRHTPAVELFIIGYKGGRANVQWNTDRLGMKNPVHRHNMLSVPAVRSVIRDPATKEAANRTQNPIELVHTRSDSTDIL